MTEDVHIHFINNILNNLPTTSNLQAKTTHNIKDPSKLLSKN